MPWSQGRGQRMMVGPRGRILQLLLGSDTYHFHSPCTVVVQLPSSVLLFATPWTAAHQASLSVTISRSLPRFISIESVMPSNHLILSLPLLLSSIFPSIRVFSNESALHIWWPEYWSFSFSISPSNEYSGLIRLTGLISLQSKGLSRVFSSSPFHWPRHYGQVPGCWVGDREHGIRHNREPAVGRAYRPGFMNGGVSSMPITGPKNYLWLKLV